MSKLEDDMELMSRTIADHYGYPTQSNQLIEECAELIQAVSKYRRADSPATRMSAMENLTEEIADVEIMLAQIKYLLRIKDTELKGTKAFKLSRAIERFKEDD